MEPWAFFEEHRHNKKHEMKKNNGSVPDSSHVTTLTKSKN